MYKVLIGLLVCFLAFGACKKEQEVERVQNLMVGTYDFECASRGPVIDSLGVYSYDTFYYSRVLDISKADNGNLLFQGTEFELVSNNNPNYYEGPKLFAVEPSLTFVYPDTILYHTYAGGHTGTYIDCIGKKK